MHHVHHDSSIQNTAQGDVATRLADAAARAGVPIVRVAPTLGDIHLALERPAYIVVSQENDDAGNARDPSTIPWTAVHSVVSKQVLHCFHRGRFLGNRQVLFLLSRFLAARLAGRPSTPAGSNARVQRHLAIALPFPCFRTTSRVLCLRRAVSQRSRVLLPTQ